MPKRACTTPARFEQPISLLSRSRPSTGSPVERVRAEVTLQELALYRFRYGFRVNDTVTPVEMDRELRPALVVDFLRRNLFGYAISAGAAGQLESDRRLLRGVVTLPRTVRPAGDDEFLRDDLA